MKTLIASVLALSAAGAAPLLAQTTAGVSDNCPLTGARGSASAECEALRADYTEKVRTCLALRRAAAEARTGTSGTGNAHASRASYLACASEARAMLGLAAE
ncbi:MAG: hypothetical protein ACK4FR_08825 [Tabrizicola sp.]